MSDVHRLHRKSVALCDKYLQQVRHALLTLAYGVGGGGLSRDVLDLRTTITVGPFIAGISEIYFWVPDPLPPLF